MSTEKLIFCTLFDSKYLDKGLTMANSLLSTDNNIFLYIFAFDNICSEILKRMKLDRVMVVDVEDFEDENLLAVKSSRTSTEYCWTCTPTIIEYCINKFKIDNCTYIDADLYFYDTPRILIEEMKNNSVLITEHRYTREYDQSEASGLYCVQFVTFKADKPGLKVLSWWKNACLEWCYNRVEDGKFGDQKYLDNWTESFKGVHVLIHEGGGVAPWNIQQYEIQPKDKKIYIFKEGKTVPLIFYHFHGVRSLRSGFFHFGPYKLSEGHKSILYERYITKLISCRNNISFPNFDKGNWFEIDDNFLNKFFNKRIRKRIKPIENKSLAKTNF